MIGSFPVLAGDKSAVYRYMVPVDDRWHRHKLFGPIVSVGARDRGTVEFWAMHHEGMPVQEWSFRVFGTGHPIHGGAEYVGTTYDASTTGLVWHLFRAVPLVTDGWNPGDPCGSCGSTDTGWEADSGAYCRTCKRTDADE
jgi:hypothetical protein